MATKTGRVLRLRFPVTCVAAYWAAWIAANSIEKLYFYSFLSQLGLSALFFAFFFGWWWFNRGLTLRQKFFGFVIIFAGQAIAGKLLDRSVNPLGLWSLGLPLVGTVIALWFKRARRLRAPFVGIEFAAFVCLAWIPFLLVRSEGVDSRLRPQVHWRWTPSTEEKFLAHSPSPNPPKLLASTNQLVAAENQWTEFRGRHREGVVHGTRISTNWTAPKTLWKREVGPAWSSMIIVGSRLFTQEQRGAHEAVVCYDADKGEEIWAHEDAARFEEALSGVGPRATPTFIDDKLYTLGATGLLNCLDASTGQAIWMKDIRNDSGARILSWGFSSSPLVVDGKVIVYAGGPKGLLAYSADKGDLLWTAPAGETSYSSAQLTSIAGVPQCVMLHDSGVMGVDLASGKKLWEAGYIFKQSPRSCQPKLVGTNTLIVGGLEGSGTSSFSINRDGDKWQVTTNWSSKDLKPEFPDFVFFKDHIFGFDVSMFCCINVADGKRVWKEGRYGRGQVVLLADQSLLLVSSEKGDLVLLAADPTAHRELGSFKALEGKTWAGPVVDGNRIYHRNAQEMACFTFAPP